MTKVRTALFGASGYTGYELVRILRRHPGVELAWITSREHRGRPLSDLFPDPDGRILVDPEAVPLEEVDVLFLALPHGASAAVAARALAAGVKVVVDLSADFRLSREAYEAWYGPHPAPELLAEARYGLSEWADLEGARLIANPGCYPTGVLLALIPLARAGALGEGAVLVDAKSGTTGAGRSPKTTTLYAEVAENLVPYQVGRRHRHVPEMEERLAALSGARRPLAFVPHLIPARRGILESLYLPLAPGWNGEALHRVLAEAYADAPFVRVLPPGQVPTLAHAAGTARCVLGVAETGIPGQGLLFAALDNLLKGAASQAVQNLNRALGWPETWGLEGLL